jgi:3-phenylpropionate/trans-cinnamate dioxygenase ferredoxin reductase subunit
LIERVVILGAGQAGAQVAISLRQGGYSGELVMVGREPHLPYQRPPLSKQVLKREWSAERCHLRHLEYYQQHDVELRLGRFAVRLDAGASRVELDDGCHLEYGALAICTGACLNRLPVPGAGHGAEPGNGLGGVHYLRTIDDSLALAGRLEAGVRLAVIGAGYIGMEVAASARLQGCEVDVIEAVDQVMKRSALPQVARFLQRRHEAEGVRIHLGRKVVRLVGSGEVSGVELDDGRVLDADCVMIGIGVRPDIDWLDGSGVATGRGLRVDEACRTSLGHVYAAGDVAELRHPLLDGWQVLESVQNAVSQGKIVASAILGDGQVYEETPWFWSEQYDCRLQMAGVPRAGDSLVARHSPETGGLSLFSLAGGVLHAVQSINAPRDYLSGRQLISQRTPVSDAQLEDPQFNLKDLL